MTSPNQARGGVKRVRIMGAELGGCSGGEKVLPIPVGPEDEMKTLRVVGDSGDAGGNGAL